MATNKKGFILYADQKELFDQLPNDKAGELIKHIFSYVNDENPITEDLLLKLAFTPIKQQLKRDLKKFEDVKDKKSISGREGNLKRWNIDLYNRYKDGDITLELAENIAEGRKVSHTDRVPSQKVANIADKDNVKDNDTVNDNVKDINNKPTAFNFRNSFLELGVDNDILNDWLKVRKAKKSVNSETAFNMFVNEVEKSKLTIQQAVELCAGRSWVSFNHKWEVDLPKKDAPNPNNEELVKWKDQVGNSGELPRSVFEKMKINNAEGGYKYTEI